MRIGAIRLGPKRERASSSSLPEKKSSSKVPTWVEAGEEGFEKKVAVDEGGEEVGPIFDDHAEGEDEEGEEDEGEKVASKRRRGLS
ncbi:hypothetical protein EV2_043025 [Malus domestica]